MKLLSLEAENVKRLKAVELTFKDGLIVIGGRNGAGKSSCLDAVAMALGGKDLVCEQPLRKGESKGHVTVTLGGPEPIYKITRRFNSKGTTGLVLEAADGSRPASPQALLDSLLGSLSFDPLAFSRMDAKQQGVVLRNLVGLDVSGIDAEIASAFTERTTAGRELTRLDASVKSMAYHADAPVQEQSIVAIADELSAAKDLSAQRESLLHQASDLRADAALDSNRAKEIDAEIAALMNEKERVVMQAKSALDESDSLKAQGMKMQIPDMEAIRKRLDEADGTNRKVRDNVKRATEAARLKQAQSSHAALDKKIETLRGKREKLILDAHFPVPGLGVTEDGVTYQEIPFSQASQAEQLRVSVAMGLAMNPTLKLLLIRDGSLLDDANVAEVARMADEAGAQILMERVGKDAATSIVIEDGMVEVEG